MKVAYDVAGIGDPLLLVSGLGQVGKRWRRVVPLLADRFTVVTFDNRETGGTGPCEGGFTLRDIAADALELMTSLGFERFFLCGISMGGMISQEIVRAAPVRVRAAVLLSTHGGASVSVQPPDLGVLGPGADGTPTWARLAGPGFYEAHPDVIDEETALSVESATPPAGYGRQMQAIQQFDGGAGVRDLGVPIVVGHGDRDPLVPYENGVRLAKALGVELVTFEGAGHVLECERVLEITELMKRHFVSSVRSA
ncbi:MAG TPA: alpha/beta hydrolase [Acidimicrobiales bacterium]|nr:alpha/beta hydrolase [Acidimicrobiales bacterium]